MGVAERADAPVPQRIASLVAGLALASVAVGAMVVVEPVAAARMGGGGGPWLPVAGLAALMLLGTTKRAFAGFDLGSLVAAVLWLGGAALYATWYRGASAAWVALVGGGWALAAVGAGVVLGRAAGGGADDTAGRIRRAAAIVGWCAITAAGLTLAAPSGVVGAIRPESPYLALITVIAASGGASGLAGAVLLATATRRDPP